MILLSMPEINMVRKKYFVWYSNWYSTEDSLDNDALKKLDTEFSNKPNIIYRSKTIYL